MAKIKIKIDDGLTPSLTLLKSQLPVVVKKAEKFFTAQTPIRTGNARRNTRLEHANSNKPTIHAAYPYAGKLDDGASAQAPEGMSKPTIRYLRRLISGLIRKI